MDIDSHYQHQLLLVEIKQRIQKLSTFYLSDQANKLVDNHTKDTGNDWENLNAFCNSLADYGNILENRVINHAINCTKKTAQQYPFTFQRYFKEQKALTESKSSKQVKYPPTQSLSSLLSKLSKYIFPKQLFKTFIYDSQK